MNIEVITEQEKYHLLVKKIMKLNDINAKEHEKITEAEECQFLNGERMAYKLLLDYIKELEKESK